VADGVGRWDVPALIAALDGEIAGRLLALHPQTGWCRACRAGAPCSMRQLAEASNEAARSRS